MIVPQTTRKSHSQKETLYETECGNTQKTDAGTVKIIRIFGINIVASPR